MKKIAYPFLLVLLITNSAAQSLSYKSESTIEGMPAMVVKMSKTSSTVYCKNNKTKTVTKTMSYTQTQITEEDKVTITNTSEPNCVLITKGDLQQDSLVNTMYVKDVKVTKSSETKKISGYTCTKTTILYKVANADAKGSSVESEMTVWCTQEIKLPQQENSLEITKQNALTKAMRSLDGFPVQTENVMKSNGMKTIVTVSDVSTKELDDSVFKIDSKACKKPMTIKEYNQYLLKQNRKPTGWL